MFRRVRTSLRVHRWISPPLPEDPNSDRQAPIVLRVPRWSGISDGRFMHNFLGVHTNPEFRPFYVSDPAGPVRPALPNPDDQTYLELAFQLRTIFAAPGPEFVFFELGAGYGHWSAQIARAVELTTAHKVRLTAVEMEPQRFRWMVEHFRANGLDPADHDLIPAAVSDHKGYSTFSADPLEQQSYGLRLAWNLRFRSRILANKSQTNDSVCTPCVRLSELLARWPRVDLVHMDIQREELIVIREARERLRGVTANLLVATHSRRLHRAIRSLLRADGWLVEDDYPPYGIRETPLGNVYFLDGLLTFRNPTLQRSAGA